MSVTARFPVQVAEVDPGGEVSLNLQLRNVGSIVDSYTFEPVGLPAGWVTVEPPTVSLYPGTEAEVRVRIAPPRAPETATGPMPFGVRVLPSEQPAAAVLPEATLSVAPFAELTAELIPHNSQGRRSARHEVAVDNRGNEPATAVLTAANPDDLLNFRIKPERIEVAPGKAGFVLVRPRARRLIWRGQSAGRPFQVLVSTADSEHAVAAAPPVSLDGAFLQLPVISRTVLRAALVAAGVVAALAGLWFGLLRPTIRSAAQDAVAEPVTQAQQDASRAANAAKDAGASENAANRAAGAAETAAGRLDPAAAGALAGAPMSTRLFAVAGPGATASATLQVRDGRLLEITDIVLQNPQGDNGILTLRRGDDILLRSALANFRDLDYHFVTPIQIDAGQRLVMDLSCTAPGGGAGTCSVASLVGGLDHAKSAGP
ncbi:hypothetical protein [Amycolatopsis taiwanensis]|uniref:Hydrolytic protein n=1 Tax=Amycolatopsis taiwanensis TaxID=342230 RepID=A0A9W6VJ12_9PSEU|nr:hypothetical protein [Amycolatopsis taiwanensis]GLY69039.1 hypothetical protein Atai01_56580 [Amycolatopsis taiwanensis]